MSNDLISRKALNENICNAECDIPKFESEKELNAFLLGLNAKQIVVMECLGSQPIAYDPDKVVEQLDRASDYYECDNAPNGTDCQMIFLDEAIDVVKGGGME